MASITDPSIAIVVSGKKPPPAPPRPILASWDERRQVWLIKEPSHGWTAAPYQFPSNATEVELRTAVVRMYGYRETKDAPIRVIPESERRAKR
jgi:hypothetical protein